MTRAPLPPAPFADSWFFRIWIRGVFWDVLWVSEGFCVLHTIRAQEIAKLLPMPRKLDHWRSHHCLANPFAPYRGPIPKNGKGGFRSRKPPISPYPRKGRFEPKHAHFPQIDLRGNGIFWLEMPFSGVGGNEGFSTPEPSFPFWGILAPARGKRIRNHCHISLAWLLWCCSAQRAKG